VPAVQPTSLCKTLHFQRNEVFRNPRAWIKPWNAIRVSRTYLLRWKCFERQNFVLGTLPNKAEITASPHFLTERVQIFRRSYPRIRLRCHSEKKFSPWTEKCEEAFIRPPREVLTFDQFPIHTQPEGDAGHILF
jgi:hypothetical protein